MNFKHGNELVCEGLGAFRAQKCLVLSLKAKEEARWHSACDAVFQRRVNTRLTSSHERHQRAPHGVRREGVSLDVAQIQLLNCASEESLGRQANLLEGDKRGEASQRPGPFMWPDNAGPGTCRSCGGGGGLGRWENYALTGHV